MDIAPPPAPVPKTDAPDIVSYLVERFCQLATLTPREHELLDRFKAVSLQVLKNNPPVAHRYDGDSMVLILRDQAVRAEVIIPGTGAPDGEAGDGRMATVPHGGHVAILGNPGTR